MTNEMRRAATAIAIVAGLAACSGAPLQQSLGTLGGDIRLIYTDSAVETYMAAHPAYAIDNTVRVSAASAPTAIVASSAYTTVNSAISSTSWRAATYSIRPPVDAGGTNFLIQVKNLYLADFGWYRFGTPSLNTPSTQESGPVMPDSAGGAGTAKHVEECAAMASVRPKLVAATTDPDALDALDTNEQVNCFVESSLVEADTGTTFTEQARSTLATLTLDEAKNGSVTLSFPLRALPAPAGARTKFAVSCATKPQPNSRLTLDVNGRANFSRTTAEVTYFCSTGGSGGNPGTVPVDLEVERKSGNLKGLFDLVGYTESAATVLTSPQYRVVAPDPIPSNQPNPSAWRMDGVQPGPMSVQAFGTVAGGSMAISLPVVNPTVPEIPSDGTDTDLGSTFVVQPVEAPGRLLLADPYRRTRLNTLTNTPAVRWGGAATSSYVQAAGDPAPVIGEPSGISAKLAGSVGRLDGTLPQNNPCRQFAEGCTLLDYRLLFSGLSPRNGPTDGSQTARTAWNVANAHLSFEDAPTSHAQSLSLILRYQRRYFSKAPTQVPATGIEEIGACFGQVEVDMRVRQLSGDLFEPTLVTYATPVNPDDVQMQPSDILSSYTNARGRPRLEADAGGVATVTAVMPEGAGYLVQPGVRFKPRSGGASTQVSGIPPVRLPASGSLACGGVVRACISINDAGAAATPVTVTFDAQPACPTASNFVLPVTVDSGGDTIDSVSYTVDGGASVPLCGTGTSVNCGTAYSGSIGPLSLASGPHTIVASAATSNGCQASNSYSFQIAASAPSLQCPANFSVMAGPGENSIPADDTRIASRLVAQASGICPSAPLNVTDNRPASFALGATPVQFSLGAASCSTSVSVLKSKKQVAFFDVNRLRLYRMEDDQFHWTVSPPGGAGPIRFHPDGSKLAVRTINQIAFLDADTGAQIATEGGAFFDFAYRPGTADDRAYVEYLDNGPGVAPDVRLKLVLGGVTTSRPLPAPGAGAVVYRPRVAWSDDGARVAVAYVAGSTLSFREWNVSGQQATPGTQGDLAGPAAGEVLLDLTYERYLNNGHLFMATDQAMYRTRASGTLQRFNPLSLTSIDLHRTVPIAFDLGANEPYFAAGAEISFLPPTPGPGAWLPYGRVKGVAASSFPISLSPSADPAIGVALYEYVVLPAGGTRLEGNIALYRLALPAAGTTVGALTLERKIRAQEPAFPRFRPYFP